ncbi:peptidoglycan-binding domain-containing protein [Roseicyclus mahoneyensis]|uniref:Putative peptidoglycan binding protein n=1 Tax=Roseicyclus mahoneyensis TaxID=164332 RepID=A0A316GLR8_9RHOB|nr:peptidoglycan-binding domain-containing protein [Roseicyclus mahoneyensis]PWK61188.1 putative peptidoglycan binding protein [Roseicyclus mahoneyensis]
MFAKFLTSASLIAAIALVPAERAEADAAEFLGGALIGGVIGHALAQGNRNTRPVTGTAPRVVRPGIPATQQGRETQLALNYFGFNAGSVDGQIGNGTRAAIERYQRAMGYPVNGREFSNYQFEYLMDAYYWGQNGGAQQTGMSGQPLLFAYRDSREGRPLPAAAPQFAPQPPATTVIVNPQPQIAPVAPAPGVLAAAPAVPNLFANSAPTASLANTCNGVMLQTSTNGGYVTLATMRDPDFTLSEQFCVARTYAMAQGEQLMQNINGLSPAQITDQCGQFAQLFSSQIDQASLTGPTQLTPQVTTIALGSGMPPADLSATARVCLSVGYAQDNMRMAVGSALALTAMGEPAYGELLGHHLREGFGTTTRPDLAMQWYNTSLSALEQGAQPAFMPGQPERTQLLRAATMQLQGAPAMPTPVPAAQQVPVPVPVPVPQNALPMFNVTQ